MENFCHHIEKQLKVHKEVTSLSPEEKKDILDHIKLCSHCRALAYSSAYPSLLKDSYGGNPPGPSEYFFSKLGNSLKHVTQEMHHNTFADILLQKGWKLVPIMIVLVLFLAGSTFYQYNNLSQINSLLTPLEETVVFKDTPLDSNFVLSAVIMEDLNYGTQNY